MNTIKMFNVIKRFSVLPDAKLRFVNQSARYSVSSSAADLKSNMFQSNLNKDRDSFLDVYPGIIDTLSKKSQFKELPEVADWLNKVLNYNLSGGKKYRGITTVLAYEMLEKPENITDETMKLARILGWCVEMVQAYLVVLDDIIDGSTTRRGVACWYKLPNVGVCAINDSILIYSALMQILKIYFSNRPHYKEMYHTFNECLTYACMGQHIDTSLLKQHIQKNYSMFTPERYNATVKYKTSYYTYKLPISLGLLMANNADESVHKIVEELSIKIGLLFQVQDDYIDCFSDESISGKRGTDIQEGKSSWLAVQALARCNNNQRKVFEKCYGSDEPAHVERIKQLYKELDLPNLYSEFERTMYDDVILDINSLPPGLSPALFTRLLDMIYKRKQ